MTTLRQLLQELVEEVDKTPPPLALGCLADRCRDYLDDHPERQPTEEELHALWNEIWSDPNRMRYMHIVYAQQILEKWGSR
jgi:hypothetical protein